MTTSPVPIPPRGGDPPGMNAVTSHVLQYINHRRSTGEIGNATAATLRTTLFAFAAVMGNRPLKQIGRPDIDRWLATISHLAPATQRLRWMMVRYYLNWCVEHRHIARSPMTGMKPPRVPRSVHRSLSPEQAAALLAACQDNRDRLIVELGLQCGLRAGEIAGVELGDIDMRARVVIVTGKGGHQRELPLTGKAMDALHAYLRDCTWIKAGPLIQYAAEKDRHRHVTAHWVSGHMRKLCWAAGIKTAAYDGVSTHALRHTAATDVYNDTGDLVVVQDMLGHANAANVRRYVRRRTTERLREAMEGRDYRTPDEAA